MNSNIWIRGSSWLETVQLKEVEHGKSENKQKNKSTEAYSGM